VAPSVQRRKLWLTPTTRVPCSDAAKTRNPLKCAGMSQTHQQISAVTGPKLTILWGHVEEILLYNEFFSSCRYIIHALVAKIQPDKVVRWFTDGNFLHHFCVLYFQHAAACSTFFDLHPKFALRPQHMWKYGRHPPLRPLRLGEKKIRTRNVGQCPT